jgi:hypothetical protein
MDDIYKAAVRDRPGKGWGGWIHWGLSLECGARSPQESDGDITQGPHTFSPGPQGSDRAGVQNAEEMGDLGFGEELLRWGNREASAFSILCPLIPCICSLRHCPLVISLYLCPLDLLVFLSFFPSLCSS